MACSIKVLEVPLEGGKAFNQVVINLTNKVTIQDLIALKFLSLQMVSTLSLTTRTIFSIFGTCSLAEVLFRAGPLVVLI